METVLLLAPLVGAIIGGFGWRLIGEKGALWLTTGLLFLSAVLSWIVFLGFDGETYKVEIMRWIVSGDLDTSWSIRMDRLTAIMLVVITSVSAFVHLYSFGYMEDDDNFGDLPYKARFFAYLSFFTFAMLALVTADNILQLFFGWEGVGLASYLLIGFYFRKPSANAAAIKAFVVNRVGDFSFGLGIYALFVLTGSLTFDNIFAAAPAMSEQSLRFLWRDWNGAEVVAFLLFVGAMGKSAQIFLHTWLPDAMEGPTPVSALIHAATMVTAGIFLMVRMSPVVEFAPLASSFVVFIGATTAFFAATVGLVQNDIKRVIAYSTCSQLGYMFVAVGSGVYGAAMFHLFTHAFFKALLFLGAGSVIIAMHHEQDMRNYGGLRKKLPVTFWTMMIGTLAITGVGIPFTQIGFAGFLSKDAVVEGAFAGGGPYAFWMLVIAAAMTSFYSWRLMFMTFWGKARGDAKTHDHAREPAVTMLVPLVVLAVGAVLAGMIWYGDFFGDVSQVAAFFGVPLAEGAEGVHAAFGGAPGAGAIFVGPENHVLTEAHNAPAWVKLSPFVAMVIGLVLAVWMYLVRTDVPARLVAAGRPFYLFLLNKWYFDELYDRVFIRGSKWFGRLLWRKGDGSTIDGVVNGIAMGFVPFVTRLAGRMQSGFLFTYAFAMVIGFAVLMAWVTLFGGAN